MLSKIDVCQSPSLCFIAMLLRHGQKRSSGQLAPKVKETAMKKRHHVTGWIFSALLALPAAGTLAQVVAAQTVSFKDDVFPIIELRCLECHQPGGPGYEASGLDLRTYESLMKGTKYGAMVIPNNPTESNLLAVVEHRTSTEIRMPHNRKKLSKCEIQQLRFWISQGARNN
jgi:hypothetical protein